jgi:hypothetical protein
LALTLTPDAFRMLLAVGWMDGRLDEAESDAILRAARAEGFEEATLDELSALSRAPVMFGQAVDGDLPQKQRLYVYGVASWVARCDAVLTPDELAALHAVATLVGVTASGRDEVDRIVEQLAAESERPLRLDLTGLKERIAQKISAVSGRH